VRASEQNRVRRGQLDEKRAAFLSFFPLPAGRVDNHDVG